MAGSTDRAVSQVIAVVLLVAITTLLAGAAAVFVLNFGSGVQEPAPNFAHKTSFDDTLAGNGQYLNVTHESGDALETAAVYVDVNGASVVDGAGNPVDDAVLEDDVLESQVGDEFQASERFVLDRTTFERPGGGSLAPDYVDLSDATVRIVYAPEGADRSDVVYECEVTYPDCENV